MKYDPNAPAFGADAQKVEDLEKPVVESEEATEETETEDKPVPYTRFKKFHSAAKQAEAEAAALRAELEELKSVRSQKVEEPIIEDAPFTLDEWTELYGDSEVSKKAYNKQVKMWTGFLEKSESKALEALEQRNYQEALRVEKNTEKIDSELESLSDYAGHELSEAEQSAILDIVDDYSPKDGNGNYISTIPFEKAYDIYELQQQAGKAPKVESRNRVASAINTKSQGSTSEDIEANKNFNPSDWGAASRRLQGR
jgi:hypothetical protein